MLALSVNTAVFVLQKSCDSFKTYVKYTVPPRRPGIIPRAESGRDGTTLQSGCYKHVLFPGKSLESLMKVAEEEEALLHFQCIFSATQIWQEKNPQNIFSVREVSEKINICGNFGNLKLSKRNRLSSLNQNCWKNIRKSAAHVL